MYSARIGLESLLTSFFGVIRVKPLLGLFAGCLRQPPVSVSFGQIHRWIIHRIVRGRWRLPAKPAEPIIVRAPIGPVVETGEMHLGLALAVIAVAQDDGITGLLSVLPTFMTSIFFVFFPFDRR